MTATNWDQPTAGIAAFVSPIKWHLIHFVNGAEFENSFLHIRCTRPPKYNNLSPDHSGREFIFPKLMVVGSIDVMHMNSHSFDGRMWSRHGSILELGV
jgi:hypothetical protein